MDPGKERYEQGAYELHFGDDAWKAKEVLPVLEHLPELSSIASYADVGYGDGGVFIQLRDGLTKRGARLSRVVGYDITPVNPEFVAAHPEIAIKQVDFVADDETFDLVSLCDVLEHMTAPQEFLRQLGPRTRYLLIHFPLDDRLSVSLANQFNYRLHTVGHISFWNACTALNLITAAGLLPIHCRFTNGFLAPSGRVSWLQRLAIPIRWLVWQLSPALAASTVGGVGLAVLCRCNRP